MSAFDYKQTLNMPKTAFEMKANLNVKEPKIQQQWDAAKIYQKLLKQNENNNQWILHDGPPYANGNIHVGHAMNKILKDIIVRYHLEKGEYSPFIAGWDAHGLPIEHALQKKMSGYNSLSTAEKRDACKNFAIENVQKQLEQFKRLGLVKDFSEIYLTLNPEFEYDQLLLFLEMVKKNLIIQDYKPVYWSWSSRSALAEAEIEYADLDAHSIYLSFDVVNGNKILKPNDKIIIWTTTPWTIPSNLAVAVNPNFEYIKVEVNNNTYVVALERFAEVAKTLGWSEYKTSEPFKGIELEHVQYKSPLTKETCPIICDEYVSNEDGTGLVHNAPGFGLDDYFACKKYGINVYCPIDDLGKFNNQVKIKELEGIFYEDANEPILDMLRQANCLLAHKKINHSAAIDWRTKKPVMYRATKQWFVNIASIQKELLDNIKDVKFPNETNKHQLTAMIANRKEWCISRQRVWGVPIPMIFDENKEPIFDVELIFNIIQLIKKHGTNIWFTEDVNFFLTDKYKNSGKTFYKEKDIMDVWFDSGSSYNLLKRDDLKFPAELYLEGTDQFRGWFNSSLICSTVQYGTAPYKRLVCHGFTLDENGHKMSKSLGNVIDPLDVCKQLGADILRLWVASVNYQEDVRISKNILAQVSETYRRIRNTLFKFVLGNLSDFDVEKNQNTNFSEIDNLMLYELKLNLDQIIEAYENYDFATVIKVANLHTINLSTWYFDIIKDSLYCDDVNSPKRRAIQTVLYLILGTYMSLLSPILPHTCEEAYQVFNCANKKESIFLEPFVNGFDKFLSIKKFDIKPVKKEYWNMFKSIKDAVYLRLEQLRAQQIINKNTQAFVKVELNNSSYNFNAETLKEYLHVAKVYLVNNEKMDSNQFDIEANKADLVRCERCWNYFDKDQIDEKGLCPRCRGVLKK